MEIGKKLWPLNELTTEPLNSNNERYIIFYPTQGSIYSSNQLLFSIKRISFVEPVVVPSN